MRDMENAGAILHLQKIWKTGRGGQELVARVKGFIGRHIVFSIILAVLLVLWAFYCPLQRITATHALNRYLIERGVAAENVYKVQTMGDFKRGGYCMCVKFEGEKDLVYSYWYGYYGLWCSGFLRKEDIRVNDSETELFGGKSVNDVENANSIVTMFEGRYSYHEERLQYDVGDLLKDIFTTKMLFKAKHFPIYLWDIFDLRDLLLPFAAPIACAIVLCIKEALDYMRKGKVSSAQGRGEEVEKGQG